MFGIDSLTRRTLRPDTIAHGPDGDVLVLVRWGRVTRLGSMWDDERAEHRSRSPCVQRGEKWVSPEAKKPTQLRYHMRQIPDLMLCLQELNDGTVRQIQIGRAHV